jgi:hypothetical protein
MASVIAPPAPDATRPVAPGAISAFVDRWRFLLLSLIVVVGALTRIHGLTSGSLFTDDAWVAITNHEPIGTALRMVVTAPGFTLFERFWTGLAPQTTWFAQLPNVASSLAGIVAVYALARYWRYPTWVALIGAAILAISAESTAFATHLKPYPDDVITAAGLLWLGERARRDLSAKNLAVVALASVIACAWSFTNAVIVGAVFAVLFITCLRRRSSLATFAITAGVAGLFITGLYLGVIRREVTPALNQYWRLSYINTGTFHAFLHSTRASIDNLIGTELGRSSHHHLLHLAGMLYEYLLVALLILGASVSWRKNTMPLVAIALAYCLAIAHKIPFGSNRTDAYLFPGLILIIGAGITWISRRLKERAATPVVAVAAWGTIAAVTLGLALSLTNPPGYIGGDLAKAMPAVDAALQQKGAVLLIEPGTRFVWAYQEDPTATIIFGPSFNTGYSFVSSRPNVIIVPQTPQEPGFTLAPSIAKLKGATHVVTLGYQMPSAPLDQQLTAAALTAACWVQTSVKSIAGFQVATYERAGPSCVPQ